MWKTTGGEVDYLGEWHTHPESIPSPSGIDQHEWSRLMSKRGGGSPLVTAIVGSTSLFVGLLDGGCLVRLSEMG
jgi:integrative and conjugative element protein (TIGR02256 family)